MLPPPPTETFASTSVCSAVLYKGLIYHAVKKEVQNALLLLLQNKTKQTQKQQQKTFSLSGLSLFCREKHHENWKVVFVFVFFPGTWPSEASC